MSGNPPRAVSRLPFTTLIHQQMLTAAYHAGTLPAFLKEAAGGDKGITFIEAASGSNRLSYNELLGKARYVLHNLQARGLAPGHELVFQIEDNQTFLTVFWACLLGNILPVPLSIGSQDSHKIKLLKVWECLRNPFLMIDSAHLKRLEHFSEQNGYAAEWARVQDQVILTEEALRDVAYGAETVGQPGDIAYIQYSSGSTGEPKGVMLTHLNLITNAQAIISRSQTTAGDAMLSWMPLTHDMGMVGVHLTGTVAGLNQYLMPTSLFVKRPLLWIDKANEYRVTQLYSPNFGYEYFLSALGDRDQYQWDLSSVRVIYNGAEPISQKLCDRFQARLRDYGLPPGVILPAYGLAEASVAVTLPPVGTGVTVHTVDRRHLNVGDAVRYLPEQGAPHGVSFVDVGQPVPDCQVRVCDRENALLPPNTIGEVQIKGRNVTQGYYNHPTGTRELLTPDDWLKTGDLGFFTGDSLVIAGRIKNTIIINGQNYYPHDIESVAREVDGVGFGKIAAGGVRSQDAPREELVLFVLHKGDTASLAVLSARLRKVVLEKMGLAVDQVIAVRKIPKTTSGKTQYYQLAEQYAAGVFDEQLAAVNDWVRRESQLPAGRSLEEKLLAVWADVLQDNRIGANDNFFTAGINSIQALQFRARIGEALHVKLSLREIFSHASVADLSRYLAGKAPDEPKAAPNGLGGTPSQRTDGLYPASIEQKRFWVIEQYKPGASPGNLCVGHRLTGKLERAALQTAFVALAQRHEILRTALVQVDGTLQQCIKEYHDAVLVPDYRDVRNSHPDARQALVSQAAHAVHDLEGGPLWKARLLQLEDDQYILLLTIHHSVADGWSLASVFFKELFTFYNAALAGAASPLPPLTMQYRDYVQWFGRKLTLHPAHQQYWQRELAGELPVIELPMAGLRPPVQSFRGETLHFRFDPHLHEQLAGLSAANSSTLFTTLAAALNVLLHKYTGHDNILLGTNAAGRDQCAFENQIGCYLRTFVIRTALDPHESFIDLLHKTKEKVLLAFEHQYYDFDALVQSAGLGRDLSRSPFFNVLVLLQNFTHGSPISAVNGELALAPYSVQAESSLVDLQFEFYAHETLSLNLTFNPDLYEETQLRRLVSHFVKIVEVAAENPLAPIASYDLLSPGEKDALLVTHNLTDVEYPCQSVVALLERQAQLTPDATAVVCNGSTITYRKLNETANQLAHLLRERYGAGPGNCIAVMLQRSAFYVTSVLAILKTGAAYVPIDPEYPTNRVRYMLADSAARVLCTDGASVNAHPELAFPRVTQESVTVQPSAYPVSNPAPAGAPDDLAYVMYTSGSTGQPKGVMISRASVADYVQTFIHYFSLTAEDAVLQQSRFTFDTAVEEIFPVLGVGGRLVVATDNRDTEALLASIARESISLLSTTPLVVNELNQQAERLSGLRVLISGGDKLQQSHIDKLFSLPHLSIYNTYGPSESTVCATFHKIESLAGTSVIGPPIANRKVYILDACLQPVVTGRIGEICIAGAGLARGYLNNPELTEAKFIPNPFAAGTRLYRTGDTGRLLPDNTIEFTGRTDDQVKIRGCRVELNEIERTLMKHPNAQGVAVIVKKNDAGEQYLVAYVVIAGTGTTSALQEFLQEWLPDYMIPRHIVAVAAFPLTANGKLDTGSLPDPAGATQAGTDRYAAPATYTEMKLTDLWRQVLRVDRIGPEDNFFDLGGHSLKATQVLQLIYRELGIRADLKTFFAHPTVRAMAIAIASMKRVQYAEIPRVPEQEYYDVSHAQKRMWILNHFDNGIHTYNMSWAYRLEGNLDEAAFTKAFTSLVQRHESLRTTFCVVAGEIKQRVTHSDPFSFQLTRLDLRGKNDREARAGNLISEEAKQKFNPEGRLLGATLLQMEEDVFLFLCTIHHIVSDGWSMDVLQRELTAGYNAYKSGWDNPLPPLRIQYKDYAAWQNKHLGEASVTRYRAYWKSQLDDAKPLDLPTDFPRSQVKTSKGASIGFSLDATARTSLLGLGRENGTSLFMNLLTLVKVLLHRYTGQYDLVIGTLTAGREHPDIENQVGFYVNTLAIRTKLEPADSFAQFLGKVKESTLGAFENQMYPFDLLVDDLNLQYDTNRPPLVDVMVLLQNLETRQRDDFHLEGLAVTDCSGAGGTSKFDLKFTFTELSGEIKAEIEYNPELFKEATITHLQSNFQRIVRTLQTKKAPVLADFDLVTTAEESEELNGFLKTMESI